MSEEVAGKIPMAAFVPAGATPPPPPPAVPPRTLRPAPVRERAATKPAPVKEAAPPREVAEPLAPYFATTPVAAATAGAGTIAAPAPVSVARRRSAPGWRASHVMMVGFLAWGLPMLLGSRLSGQGDVRGLMDAALALQIIGYLVGGLAVAFLVYRVQHGDWDSVGLRWSERSLEDTFRGFGLGLVLIGAFIGGTYLITQELGIDGLVRMLVGGTTGPGFVLGALAVVVGAPVMEEIYFRGMLYERFGRLMGVTAAVIGTTILFVLAHRVGLWDPPRLLLGLSLGLARRSKSLWFTIGGHAAWNLVVIGLGVSMLMGPSQTFTAADGSFTLRHPPDWAGAPQEEIPPGSGLDLMMVTPGGSFIGVARQELPPGWNRSNLGQLLGRIGEGLPMAAGMKLGPVEETSLVRGDLAKTYEMEMTFSDPVLGDGKARVVAVVRDGTTKLMTAVMACPVAECASADADFDGMLRSVQFSR